MTENNDDRLKGNPARHAVYGELMWPEWRQVSESYGTGYDRALELLDAHEAEVLAAGLSDAERQFLTFALDMAEDAMSANAPDWTDGDRAALASLRALAAGAGGGDGRRRAERQRVIAGIQAYTPPAHYTDMPHCDRGEWESKARERGWAHDTVNGRWLCPSCVAAAEQRAADLADISDEPDAEPGTPDDAERERLQDEAEIAAMHEHGDHSACGVACEVSLPSEYLRNFMLRRAYPGAGGALDELLRRERAVRDDALTTARRRIAELKRKVAGRDRVIAEADQEFGDLRDLARGFKQRAEAAERRVAELEASRPCGRSATHPPHKWMAARRAVQCPGVGDTPCDSGADGQQDGGQR